MMNSAARVLRRFSFQAPQAAAPAALLRSGSQHTTTPIQPQVPVPLRISAETPAITSSFHTQSLSAQVSSSFEQSQSQVPKSPPPPAPEAALQTLTLPTGRNITYRCFGPPDGSVLFYFHGSPSGAIDGVGFKEFIEPRGIRLICTNRPGFGQSDLQSDRTISDHAHDVIAIADSLGIDKFRVMGASGGGPYVLACAKIVPKERLLGAAVVAGVAPNEYGSEGMGWDGYIRFFLIRRMEWLLVPLIRRDYNRNIKGKSPEELEKFWMKAIEYLKKTVGPKDQEAMDNKKLQKEAIDCFNEAYERGYEGAVDDGRLLVGDWDFKLEDIPDQGERVRMYFGKEDKATPVQPARKMAEAMPKSQLVEYDDDGHWSIFLNRGDAIFDHFYETT